MTPQRKRILIAGGLIALAVLAYLYIRNRGSSPQSLTGPMSTGQPTDGSPAAPSDAGSGGGGPAASDAGAADLISTLAGENQALLQQLLASAQGFPSLLGAPFGAPAGTIGGPAAPPATVTPSAPQPPPSNPPLPSSPTFAAPSYAGMTEQTLTEGPAAGAVIYTPTTAEATVVNASPNALRTIGSDAAQSAPKPKPTAPKPAPKTFLTTHAAPR